MQASAIACTPAIPCASLGWVVTSGPKHCSSRALVVGFAIRAGSGFESCHFGIGSEPFSCLVQSLRSHMAFGPW